MRRQRHRRLCLSGTVTVTVTRVIRTEQPPPSGARARHHLAILGVCLFVQEQGLVLMLSLINGPAIWHMIFGVGEKEMSFLYFWSPRAFCIGPEAKKKWKNGSCSFRFRRWLPYSTTEVMFKCRRLLTKYVMSFSPKPNINIHVLKFNQPSHFWTGWRQNLQYFLL